jgi:RNA polymerase sigma-70 factor (ECF subfamily)
MEHSVKHLRAVLSVARTILNLADAEEVAQEALLKALSNIQGFRGQTRFSTWLIQITVYEARNRLRQNGQPLDGRQTDDADEYVPKDFIDWREIPSAALERKGVRDALQQALASLPQNCREVFTLRDMVHLSDHETAQVLGLTVKNVKTQLLRARLQLRDALAPGLNGRWCCVFSPDIRPEIRQERDASVRGNTAALGGIFVARQRPGITKRDRTRGDPVTEQSSGFGSGILARRGRSAGGHRR